MSITVLVADTQILFADALTLALGGEADLDVADERPVNGVEALQAAADRHPDVALVDYWLGDRRCSTGACPDFVRAPRERATLPSESLTGPQAGGQDGSRRCTPGAAGTARAVGRLRESARVDGLHPALPLGGLATKQDLYAVRDELVARFDRRFDAMDGRFDAMDERFAGVNGRLDGVNERFAGVNARLDGVNARLDGLLSAST